MISGQNSDVLIIRGSPVDFVLVGPRGSRIGLIARSEAYRLDLLGFTVSTMAGGAAAKYRSYRRPQSSLISTLLDASNTTQMNVVECEPIDDPINPYDDRLVSYRFSWIGKCSEERRRDIQSLLDTRISDMYRALRTEDPEHIEWSISPMIYLCREADIEVRRQAISRILLYAISLLIVATLFFALVIPALQRLLGLRLS